MNAKEAEEKSTSIEIKHRHKIRHEFWERLLERMTDSSCRMFDNISPSKDQWLGAGSGVRNCRFNLIFGTKEARVELYLSRQAPEENNFVFDELFKQRADIEEKFGSPIDWQRLDSKKACRIKVSKEFDGYNREHWPEIVEWLIHNMTKFELAFKSALLEVNRQLKSTSFEEQGVI
nr:DUF4268 domain-containing protein [Vibrio crassostreae]